MAEFNLPGIEIRIAGRRVADARVIENIPLRASEGAPLGRLQQGTVLEKALPAEQDLYDRILGFEVIERDFGANEMTLRLDNRDMKLFGALAASPGQLDIFHNAVWIVKIGYPNDTLFSREFAFVINQVKGFKELLVRGYEDSFIRIDSKAKWRTFRDNRGRGVRRSAVARKIAKEHGFALPRGAILRTGGQFQKIVQAGITDAQLLTRMAKAAGYIWWVSPAGTGRTDLRDFHFRPRDHYTPTGRSARFNIGVDHFVIRDFLVDTNIFNIPRTAMSAALDPFDATMRQYRAGNDTTQRQVSGTMTPLDPSLPFASRMTPQQRDEAAVIWSSSSAGLPTQNRIQEDLDGLWKTFEASMIQAKLTVLGDPSIAPRESAWLEGIGQLSGYYYIKEARHMYRQGSVFETELTLLKNAFSRTDVLRAKWDLMALVRNRSNPEAAEPEGETDGPSRTVSVQSRQMGDSPDAETVSAPLRGVKPNALLTSEGEEELEEAASSK